MSASSSSIYDLTRFFHALDPLRPLLSQTLDGWGIPAIPVFGAESVGKSTVLETIAQRRIFPQGENICTRLPIRVCMRNTPEEEDLQSASSAQDMLKKSA